MGVFSDGYDQAILDAGRMPVGGPPAEFLETFSAGYDVTKQEDLSTSEALNLGRHRAARREKIKELTGEDIGSLEGLAIPQMHLAPEGRTSAGAEAVRLYRYKIADLAATYPEDIPTDEEILMDIKEESRRLRERYAATTERTTFGGKIGSFVGAMAATMQDPLVLSSMMFGASASAGILRTALTEAGIGAFSEATLQPTIYRYKKKLDSPYGPGEAAMRIAGAGAGSGLLAGLLKSSARGLETVVGRIRKPKIKGFDDLLAEGRALRDTLGDRLSPEVRDAIEVMEDYADTLRETPFDPDSPAATEAHLKATGKAISDVEAGRPAEVQDIVRGLEPREEVLAYHGSPHEFDRFDLEHVGTGEGAQSYGHGLYFAENLEVAKEYLPRRSWQVVNKQDDSAEPFVAMVLDEKQRPLARKTFAVMRDAENWARDLAARSKGSQLYRVAIRSEDVDRMLDWDKPLTEQPAQVKRAAANLGITEARSGEDLLWQIKRKKYSVQESVMGNVESPANRYASESLAASGVPGIKYLDQGSRAVGEGTRNFVVFDPAIIRRTEREVGEGFVKVSEAAPAPEPGSTSPARIIRNPAPPTRPTENQSLSQFVKNSGGVSVEKAGALRGEYDGLFQGGGRTSGAVKRKAGLSPDEMAQLAHESGFIDEPDPAMLAEALDRDQRGDKVFSNLSDRAERKVELDVEREFQAWAEMEEGNYLKQLDATAKAILDAEDVEIPVGEFVEEGNIKAMVRSARELVDEAEVEVKAGNIIKKCLMGG